MPIKESKGAKVSEAELRADIESYLKSFLDERDQSMQQILHERISTVIFEKRLDEQSIENDQKEIDFEQTKFVNKIIERVLKGTR